MKCTLCVLLLTFGMLAFAQPQYPSDPPPHATPPDPQAPQRGMPPDTKAPPPQQLSSSEVQSQIQGKLNSEPALADATVLAKANATSVILSGTVDTEAEHQLALDIAESYAGNREIVDRIQVRGRT